MPQNLQTNLSLVSLRHYLLKVFLSFGEAKLNRLPLGHFPHLYRNVDSFGMDVDLHGTYTSIHV